MSRAKKSLRPPALNFKTTLQGSWVDLKNSCRCGGIGLLVRVNSMFSLRKKPPPCLAALMNILGRAKLVLPMNTRRCEVR